MTWMSLICLLVDLKEFFSQNMGDLCKNKHFIWKHVKDLTQICKLSVAKSLSSFPVINSNRGEVKPSFDKDKATVCFQLPAFVLSGAAVGGGPVWRCATTLPAWYSWGRRVNVWVWKRSLRSRFVDFTGALGESGGHTPPATATGVYAFLKCKCASTCAAACRGGGWVCVYRHAHLWVCLAVTHLESSRILRLGAAAAVR